MGCSQSKSNDVTNSTIKPIIAAAVQSPSEQIQHQQNVTKDLPPILTPTMNQPEIVNSAGILNRTDSPMAISTSITDKLTTEDSKPSAIDLNNGPNTNGLASQKSIVATSQKANVDQPSNVIDLVFTPETVTPINIIKKPAFMSISPHVGFVIKTKHILSGDKIFINVLYHEAITTPVPCDAQTSTDKKGEQCLAYSVVVPARLYQASYAYDSPEINKVSTEAIQLVNSSYGVNLDMDYKIPKMKRGYVGDKVDDLLIALPVVEEVERVPEVVVTRNHVEETKDVEVVQKDKVTKLIGTTLTPPPAPVVEQVVEIQPVIEKISVAHRPPTPPQVVVSTPPEPVVMNNPQQNIVFAPEVHESVLSKGVELESDEEFLPSSMQVSTRPVPPKMHGWLKKQGHLVKNWKSRYFVLDNGYVTYYVDKLDSPPFGRDMKGQLCLAGYREKEVTESAAGNGKRGSSANLDSTLWANRIYLVYDATLFTPEDDAVEGDDQFQALLLEASSLDEKNAWLAAIQAHTEYFESTLVAAANPLMHSQSSSNSLNGILDADSATNPVESAPAMKRSSTAGGMGSSRSLSRSPSRQSTYSVLEDKKRWAIFLHADEELVLTGLAGKPNPVGIHLIRQLILTSRKRLLYIDTKTMELKGEIEWSSNPAATYPQAKKIDENTFDVVESAKRTYRFICKDSCTAGMWVTAISNTAPPPPAHNKWQS